VSDLRPTQKTDRVFLGGSDTLGSSGFTQTGSWTQSGAGSAVFSAGSLPGGQTKQFLLKSCPYHTGTVTLKAPLQEGIGVCIGVPVSSQNLSSGVYAGVLKAANNDLYLRIWIEGVRTNNFFNTTATQGAKPYIEYPIPVGINPGDAIEMGLISAEDRFLLTFGLDGNAKHMGDIQKQTNGSVYWNSHARSAVTNYAGAWSDGGSRQVNALKVVGFAEAGTGMSETLLEDNFNRASGNWSAASAQIPPTGHLELVAPSSNTTIASNRLVCNASPSTSPSAWAPFIGKDLYDRDNKALGLVWRNTFQYQGGSGQIAWMFRDEAGFWCLGINSNGNGTNIAGLIAGASDTKGAIAWGDYASWPASSNSVVYIPAITAGTWIRVTGCVERSGANPTETGASPFGFYTRWKVDTSTDAVNWTNRLFTNDGSTGASSSSGRFNGMRWARVTGQSALNIDSLKIETLGRIAYYPGDPTYPATPHSTGAVDSPLDGADWTYRQSSNSSSQRALGYRGLDAVGMRTETI